MEIKSGAAVVRLLQTSSTRATARKNHIWKARNKIPSSYHPMKREKPSKMLQDWTAKRHLKRRRRFPPMSPFMRDLLIMMELSRQDMRWADPMVGNVRERERDQYQMSPF